MKKTPVEKTPVVGPGKIILSPALAKRREDNRFFTNRFSLIYLGRDLLIEQHKRTREWRCNCSEFQNSNTLIDQTKHCRHLRDLGIPGGGEAFEVEIRFLKGLQLRVAQTRAKVQNERKRLQQP